MRIHGTTAAVLAGAGLICAGWWVGSRSSLPAPLFAPAPAAAGEILEVEDGATFISTDGGSAYLWRRHGNRIELVGQCVRTTDASEAQATFVWLPGVERRS